MHKRKSFEHEREVRALVFKLPTNSNHDFTEETFRQETIEHGLQIEVDIEKLIEHIYVAPNAQERFVNVVKSVVAKYSFDFKVAHSDLKKVPVY